MAGNSDKAAFPQAERRLRLGVVGGGQGSFIGKVHARGARLSNRWDVVAGALSSRPQVAKESGREWLFDEDRAYTDYCVMAEREAARPDGIDAVAIATPNNSHHAIAVAFMEKGIDVISDKPLTTTLDDALDLVRRQKETGLVFAVTYAYASSAMVRQARQMIREGALGTLKQVHVEYFQEWALTPSKDGGAGAQWRVDPAIVGPTFTTGDIGTHCHHLGAFVCGRPVTSVRAEFHTLGPEKPLEDTAFMHVRYEGDIPGTIMISQVAPGAHCGLRIRAFGDKASLEWNQEEPEVLHFRRFGEPARLLTRGAGAGIGIHAARFVHMPRGHPEALSDAWGNLYEEFAIAVEARRLGRTLPDGLLDYPTVTDGALGVKFIEAALASSQSGDWTDCRLPA
ncbi:Gfo/Idh/MocA family oxidoreductase [Shinella zoogloeoides]|uniref:Gfo/Idh/MocA family protein n=1 Tax=Shinella zoogloeoides TaxID=352475 RepID=UPI00299EA1F0|nr:Gfo/Idh/MocA family oxidoreductase [Shinella zoogloeoides]WPE23843.1 Inositol 2-dehydrogenase/D-chiro-inositol 3-dehydrogenase [Shinella zoogloeoides]